MKYNVLFAWVSIRQEVFQSSSIVDIDREWLESAEYISYCDCAPTSSRIGNSPLIETADKKNIKFSTLSEVGRNGTSIYFSTENVISYVYSSSFLWKGPRVTKKKRHSRAELLTSDVPKASWVTWCDTET